MSCGTNECGVIHLGNHGVNWKKKVLGTSSGSINQKQICTFFHLFTTRGLLPDGASNLHLTGHCAHTPPAGGLT